MPKTQPPTSVAEIVRESGIPKRTVIAAIERKELKAHKLPGRTGAYVISRNDADRWLAMREEQSA